MLWGTIKRLIWNFWILTISKLDSGPTSTFSANVQKTPNKSSTCNADSLQTGNQNSGTDKYSNGMSFLLGTKQVNSAFLSTVTMYCKTTSICHARYKREKKLFYTFVSIIPLSIIPLHFSFLEDRKPLPKNNTDLNLINLSKWMTVSKNRVWRCLD